MEEVPSVYENRTIYRHGPYITGIRTSSEELKKLAGIVSEKLNKATGPVAVVIPGKGFSALDREGFSFFEPETDKTFSVELKRTLKKEIEFIELDAHIFDELFVAEVANTYDRLAKRERFDYV